MANRILLTALSGLALAACARDPVVSVSDTTAAGNWRIEKQIDRVTGVPISSSFVTAPSSHTSEAFPRRAALQLSCFNKARLVRFGFEVKVGTTRSAELGYRFDEKPGHEISARFLDDDKAAVIEEPAQVAQFVDELATSQTLYVRIRSLRFGRSSAEFNVTGAPDAITAAYAGCPPAVDKPRAR